MAVTDKDGKYSFTIACTPTYGEGLRKTIVFRKPGLKEARQDLHAIQVGGRHAEQKVRFEVRMEGR